MPIDNRSSWIRVCRQWLGSRDGNFGVMLGLVAPMLAVSIAGGIDFLSATSQKQAMQAAADSAAIAAVREASLKGWRPDLAAAITYSVAEANYETHHAAESYFSVKSDVDVDRRRVTVVIEQDHYPYFFARAFPTPQLRVEATATAAGSTNICVIGLEKTRPDTVLLDKLGPAQCLGMRRLFQLSVVNWPVGKRKIEARGSTDLHSGWLWGGAHQFQFCSANGLSAS